MRSAYQGAPMGVRIPALQRCRVETPIYRLPEVTQPAPEAEDPAFGGIRRILHEPRNACRRDAFRERSADRIGVAKRQNRWQRGAIRESAVCPPARLSPKESAA